MIITIIGRRSNKEEIEKKTKEFSLQGHIVLQPVLCSEEEMPRYEDILIDLQKAKINISDKVFVINTHNYISDNEKLQIQYAIATHTPVEYMNYMQDRFDKNDRYTMNKGHIIQTIIYKGTNPVEAKGCFDMLTNKKIKDEPMLLTGTGYSVKVLDVNTKQEKNLSENTIEYEVGFKAMVV